MPPMSSNAVPLKVRQAVAFLLLGGTFAGALSLALGARLDEAEFTFNNTGDITANGGNGVREINGSSVNAATFTHAGGAIDVDSGGSIDGVIAACDGMLESVNEETRLVPGHGAILVPAELREYRDMLATIRGRVAALIEEGLDLAAVQASGPTREFDAGGWGELWLDGDSFTEMVFNSLSD